MKKFALLLLILPFATYAQWDQVQMKSTQLAENIYFLKGRGGNIGVLIGENATLLVDDQFAPLSEKITTAVKEISKGEIKYVINTHYHGDHTGGNENFKNSGALIVAHENVRKRLGITFEDPIKDRTIEAKPESFWPTAQALTQEQLSEFSEEIAMIYLPNAHTDGDVMVHFPESNVLHTGDAFVRYGYPFIDVSAGGTIDGFIAAQEKILSIVNNETKIIPGHGQVSGKADVEELLQMLKETRSIIAEAKETGTKLEDLIPQKPFADYHGRWNGNFINSDLFVQLIYESL